MPIQFRCIHCGRVLSISSRKAGATVNCPACTEPIQVPGEVAATETISQVSAHDTSRPTATPAKAPSPVGAQPPAAAPTRPAAAPVAATTPPPRPVAAAAPAPVASSGPSALAALWAEPDEEPPEPKPKRKAPEDGLDMTPMVDVTFQLLIFFMITASFAVQKALQTTAPEPSEEQSQQVIQIEQVQEESVIVSIDSTDNIMVDDEPVEGIYALAEILQGKITFEYDPSAAAEYKAILPPKKKPALTTNS